MPHDDVVQTAADRLFRAAQTREPCSPVRDLIDRDDVDSAYAVQREITARRVASGGRIVGRKIGLTSEAVQKQLGVDRPDFGVLFDDMRVTDGAAIPVGAVLQPRVEAEVAFVLGADLDHERIDIAAVRNATAYATAAIEICGSRIRDWDITFVDTVADNASSGAFVLSDAQIGLDGFEPRDVQMTMNLDGDEVSSGSGAACLGDPLAAVAWLATTLRGFGDPLRAGDIVLSGALGPMRPAHPGARVVATVSGLGSVSVQFGEG